jgi:membrane protein implicated in regulation of membrane protease activity
MTLSVGVAAGFVRMLLLIAAPIVIAIVALVTETDIGGGKWVTALIALLVVSALATLLWLSFRWVRRRRKRSRLVEAT